MCPLDPDYPAERLAFLLRDSAAPVLLTQKRLLPSLPDCPARVLCLDADASTFADMSDVNPLPLATPDNLAYVIYTSGSTGVPKGVAMSHAPLCEPDNLAAQFVAGRGKGPNAPILFTIVRRLVPGAVLDLVHGGNACPPAEPRPPRPGGPVRFSRRPQGSRGSFFPLSPCTSSR